MEMELGVEGDVCRTAVPAAAGRTPRGRGTQRLLQLEAHELPRHIDLRGSASAFDGCARLYRSTRGANGNKWLDPGQITVVHHRSNAEHQASQLRQKGKGITPGDRVTATGASGAGGTLKAIQFEFKCSGFSPYCTLGCGCPVPACSRGAANSSKGATCPCDPEKWLGTRGLVQHRREAMLAVKSCPCGKGHLNKGARGHT